MIAPLRRRVATSQCRRNIAAVRSNISMSFRRRARRFQMALREMQVNGSGFKVGVAEQQLHRRQGRSSFQ